MTIYKCPACMFFQTLNKTKTCQKCGVNQLTETNEMEILAYIANMLREKKYEK